MTIWLGIMSVCMHRRAVHFIPSIYITIKIRHKKHLTPTFPSITFNINVFNLFFLRPSMVYSYLLSHLACYQDFNFQPYSTNNASSEHIFVKIFYKQLHTFFHVIHCIRDPHPPCIKICLPQINSSQGTAALSPLLIMLFITVSWLPGALPLDAVFSFSLPFYSEILSL